MTVTNRIWSLMLPSRASTLTTTLNKIKHFPQLIPLPHRNLFTSNLPTTTTGTTTPTKPSTNNKNNKNYKNKYNNNINNKNNNNINNNNNNNYNTNKSLELDQTCWIMSSHDVGVTGEEIEKEMGGGYRLDSELEGGMTEGG